jgi:asparagine synthase (glutamine-hydrolysing)
MCGICGIVHFDKERKVDCNTLETMTDIMVHRGPDDRGLFIKNQAGFGHRRLSIIDLSEGHQPMANEDSTVWITFNGEIYNYLELRSELIKKGHLFKTRSDTETIIHAYEEYGEKCLEKLRGMFAFAIWDEKRQQVFAARDRIGKKPLYYAQVDEALVFGSEIKSVLQYGNCKREIDLLALDLYLSLRYVPGPRTMFKGIFKLQPGHYLILKNNHLSIYPYWDVQNSTPPKMRNEEDCIQEFLSLLNECVRMRLMSEVPLGVFLSGGIDSSLVVALMSRMVDTPIKTFSVGYEADFGTNEFDYAKSVAEKYNTEHYELRIGSSDFYEFIPKLVWHLDEPIADPATIPLFFLSEFAKKFITVVLSGEGADEILAGYYIYKKMLSLEKFQTVTKFVGRDLLLGIGNLILRQEKYQRYLKLATLPLTKRYQGVSNSFSSKAKESIAPDTRRFNGELEKVFGEYYRKVETWPNLSKMLYIDLKVWLPDDLLMKADKMTMAASMELRVPFLDHELVQFAFSLPDHFKINGNKTKYLLRQIGKELLPPPIIEREKRGFPVPISQWLQGDLNQVARETLLDSKSACGNYFEPESVKSILKRHSRREEDLSEQIWNLLVFEFWCREFIQRSNRGGVRG